MQIRAAEDGDLPAILAIYNDVVASSAAIYTSTPSTLAERAAWLEARRRRGFPVLVATDGADVLGFASFGEFRAWPGYRCTVEHSVHVRAASRRRGVGRALVEALVPLAREQGAHVLVGCIDSANAASLALHERLGFERVALFREVGRKFGRWLDVVFVQRMVTPPGAPPSAEPA